MKNNKLKLIAGKMKNNSDALKKFTRINPETDKPLFTYPEGKYIKVGKRYIKQDE